MFTLYIQVEHSQKAIGYYWFLLQIYNFQIINSSSREDTGPNASSDDGYTSIGSTYGFTAYSHRRQEENFYEQMKGSFKTFSE